MEANRTSVYFSKEENKLFEYASLRGMSFSNYVKRLIKEDKEKGDNFKQQVIEIIEEYLSNKNICIEESKTDEYTDKDKEELMNMLNL